MKNIRIFLFENFSFLEVKFSMYLNRCVFVMQRVYFCDFIFAFFEPKNYFLSNYTLLGWFKCSSFVEAEKKNQLLSFGLQYACIYKHTQTPLSEFLLHAMSILVCHVVISQRKTPWLKKTCP